MKKDIKVMFVKTKEHCEGCRISLSRRTLELFGIDKSEPDITVNYDLVNKRIIIEKAK